MSSVESQHRTGWNVRPNTFGTAFQRRQTPSHSNVTPNTVGAWVADHAAISLGVGFLAGAMLGWFLKRK